MCGNQLLLNPYSFHQGDHLTHCDWDSAIRSGGGGLPPITRPSFIPSLQLLNMVLILDRLNFSTGCIQIYF